MSSPSDTIVSSTVASVESVPASPEVKEPWLPDQDELASVPWYEEKSSNLKLSDIAVIKEKGETMGRFEVVLPHPDERAHRPPPGFHTFYVNQLDMGLRFPIPMLITSSCHHIKISPSQLAPNSYSFLLALAVLVSYHNIPLIPYVLMQLVQIKRLGPGKFYISHKGDHTFIKGNTSSHKRWMSRFFYIKRDGKRRDPWRCEMSCRDNVYTFASRTPERSPNLTSFLEAMRDTRMGKAEMLQFMEETEEAVVPHKKVAKKRKASTPAEKEAWRQRNKGASSSGARPERTIEERRASTPPIQTTDERPNPTQVVNIPEVSSSEKESMKESGPGRVPTLNYFEDSLVVPPTAAVATKYLCHMDPDRDFDRLAGASDSEAAVAWGDEVIKRLTQAQRVANETRLHFFEAMGHHTELVAQLEELKAIREQEQNAAEAVKEALRAQLATERRARATAEEDMRYELEAALNEKTAVEAKLEETKARVAEEAEHTRDEVANAWALEKEEFLQFSEFKRLCTKKSMAYFKSDFEGAVAQFRANSYSEEEHPAPFLNLKKALQELREVVTSAKLGLSAQVGLPLEEVPVWNWTQVPSWSGLRVCVEELREVVSSAELDLGARVGLPPEEVPVRKWT
ncbi:hypothetical protein F511_15584 [Dorcoceras hygrometricum]|uniref:Uncharacterized protein n=1 Tax=Dorcoceras hygrometricum TaxID=472368 RepID=A0A2Z7B9P3_9LAMI|nr:hypothetical protein F511_15584 [Dorcoceras hygrometricum]